MIAKTLEQRWTTLDGKKSAIMALCEEYSSYTLPDVFPIKGVRDVELQNMIDPIGARAVNHLANRVTSVLFQPNQPFFRLAVDDDTLMMAAKLSGAEEPEDIGKIKQQIDGVLSKVEQQSMKYLDMVTFRPMAVMAAKLLIITGNALVYMPPKSPAQVFTLRDYCVVRDYSGIPIEIMTRECKAYETFNDNVKEQLRQFKGSKKDYEDDTEVVIYTQIKLNDAGKYELKQAANNIPLDSEGMWAPDVLPYIPLTWDYIKGEDYGRGYVAGFSGTFHGIKILSSALLNIAGIMADLKYLVNPSSFVDVKALNESPPGSYHSGKDGDVTAIQQNKQADAQFIQGVVASFEKQIAEAFLLNSSAVRDAERVTAEEVRMQANELETSLGGIYSRLASIWQLPTANIVLEQIQFKSEQTKNIKPQIVTGMDSLSRQSEMDNFRLWVSDLQLLQVMPPELLAEMDLKAYALFAGRNRQVDAQSLMLSDAQKQAKAAQQAAAMQAQQDSNTNAAVQQEAGKAAVQPQR